VRRAANEAAHLVLLPAAGLLQLLPLSLTPLLPLALLRGSFVHDACSIRAWRACAAICCAAVMAPPPLTAGPSALLLLLPNSSVPLQLLLLLWTPLRPLCVRRGSLHDACSDKAWYYS